jgi:hypothetical protein
VRAWLGCWQRTQRVRSGRVSCEGAQSSTQKCNARHTTSNACSVSCVGGSERLCCAHGRPRAAHQHAPARSCAAHLARVGWRTQDKRTRMADRRLLRHPLAAPVAPRRATCRTMNACRDTPRRRVCVCPPRGPPLLCPSRGGDANESPHPLPAFSRPLPSTTPAFGHARRLCTQRQRARRRGARVSARRARAPPAAPQPSSRQAASSGANPTDGGARPAPSPPPPPPSPPRMRPSRGAPRRPARAIAP